VVDPVLVTSAAQNGLCEGIGCRGDMEKSRRRRAKKERADIFSTFFFMDFPFSSVQLLMKVAILAVVRR
jgi:hypothetical protein